MTPQLPPNLIAHRIHPNLAASQTSISNRGHKEQIGIEIEDDNHPTSEPHTELATPTPCPSSSSVFISPYPRSSPYLFLFCILSLCGLINPRGPPTLFHGFGKCQTTVSEVALCSPAPEVSSVSSLTPQSQEPLLAKGLSPVLQRGERDFNKVTEWRTAQVSYDRVTVAVVAYLTKATFRTHNWNSVEFAFANPKKIVVFIAKLEFTK
ncbi:hypothetical protein F7725_025374 [Dissostichus mawsoni]|uniref:Uncharacterized protein n=1 Tax=Dissostichus mawsoni TaxID=36200 RepID=A0A7J5XAZ3_DISMA|nr:hypothetical protein F7725_025374 [Dissostichus mawsoni]